MDRPSTWFIPFCLALAVVTAPLAVRDPLVAAPALLAATVFGAHLLWGDREPGRMPHPLLSAAWVLLAVLSGGLVALTILSLL